MTEKKSPIPPPVRVESPGTPSIIIKSGREGKARRNGFFRKVRSE